MARYTTISTDTVLLMPESLMLQSSVEGKKGSWSKRQRLQPWKSFLGGLEFNGKSCNEREFQKNYPLDNLPPESWFDLTDEERERATCAPVSWKFGILPPEEFKKI